MCNTLYTEAYQSSLKYFSKLSHNTHTYLYANELDSANGQSVPVQDFFFLCVLKGQVVEDFGGVGG